MTILQLLKRSDPISWVQGHHTRIIRLPGGAFETVCKRRDLGEYTIVRYHGETESMAVAAFIKSEEV